METWDAIRAGALSAKCRVRREPSEIAGRLWYICSVIRNAPAKLRGGEASRQGPTGGPEAGGPTPPPSDRATAGGDQKKNEDVIDAEYEVKE